MYYQCCNVLYAVFVRRVYLSLVFFFNHPAPTDIYTLSLHDALPISHRPLPTLASAKSVSSDQRPDQSLHRSEEHTSELQSRENLVCRLLLEKKNDVRTDSLYVLYLGSRTCASPPLVAAVAARTLVLT